MTPEKWYNFFSISGVVLDSSSKSERVYSQGYSALAGVSYKNVNVNQTTSVWIKDSSGQERKLTFDGILPVRPGHEVTVLYMHKKGTEKGQPFAAYNATAKILVRLTCRAVRINIPYKDESGFIVLGFCLGLIATLVSFFSFNTSLMSNTTAAFALVASLVWTISTVVHGYLKTQRTIKQIEELLVRMICLGVGFEGGRIPPDVTVKLTD